MSQQHKKIRIADIAAAAGVSSATVSRVMNNQSIVNGETYKKVISVMNDLGYENRMNTHAAGGKDKPHDLIILNLPSINNPFYNEITKGAQSAAHRYGFHLLVSTGSLEGQDLTRFLNLIKTNNVAGVITVNSLSAASLEKLCAVTQVVQCCEFCETYDVPYVSIDDYGAAKMALNYILSRQRKEIAFINGPIHYKYARHRLKGYIDFLQENGLVYREDWILQLSDINFDMALAAITQLLSKPNRPNAIFAVSDVYASAAVKVANKYRLNIPGDIMILGFDNTDISIMSDPPITTVNQPKLQLGYMACELLLERIATPTAASKHILLDTELIIRESTM